MKFIFNIIYNFLDRYIHRQKIKKQIEKLNLDQKIIFDVGSHEGETLNFLMKIFPQAKYFGFEPQKKCFKKLKKKFLFNKNVKVFNCALGQKNQSKTLYYNSLSTTSTFSLINSKSKHYKIKSFFLSSKFAGFYGKQKVKVKTLAQMIRVLKIKKIELLKIDTEGHELEVLKGLKSNIKNIKIIFIEHNFTDYYLKYNLKEIVSFLKKNKFKNIVGVKFPFMQYSDEIYFNTKFMK